MDEILQTILGRSALYKQLKNNCDKDKLYSVLSLVSDVGSFSISKLKTVMKNMPEFTLHDEVHVFNILAIMEKLIPLSTIEKLSSPDLLMLILGAFLHDIGMAPEEKYIRAWKNLLPNDDFDDDIRKESESFQRFRLTYPHQLSDIEKLKGQNQHVKAQLIEEYIITEYIRSTHSIRARQIIAKHWNEKIVYNDTDLTEDLATICFSHNESYTYLLNMEPLKLCSQDTYLCLPFVATILRLADIIDFDPKRTPAVLFSHLTVRNPVSIKEWLKHQSINAWTISASKLVYSTQCEHPAIEAAIQEFCDQIDDELRNGTVVLSNLTDEGMEVDINKYKIPLPPRVDRIKIKAKKDIFTGKPIYRYHDTKFSLSKKQIVDLLMGTKLYGKPEVALRELLQNSLDACLLRQKLSESWGVEYTPQIVVSLFTDNDVDYLRVTDNGIGMNQHIIDNYYTNIGSSYYSSREFGELISSIKTSFTPISRFGIGILSCFMVCDSMDVSTRRVKDRFECDDAIHISIEGYESLFVITDSDQKEPGTSTTLMLRPVHPWDRMDENEFIISVRNIVPNPAVKIEICTDKSHEVHTSENFDELGLEHLLDYTWQLKKKNIKYYDIDLTDAEYGFKGKACIVILSKNGIPISEINLLSKDIEIDGNTFTLSSDIKYGRNCIIEESTNISADEDGGVSAGSSYNERFKSKSALSVHGIDVPCKLFYDYFNRDTKTLLEIPFPTSFRLDISGNNDLNLNSARNQIIYDDKWLAFETNFYRTVCKQLSATLKPTHWRALKKVMKQNSITKIFKKIIDKY